MKNRFCIVCVTVDGTMYRREVPLSDYADLQAVKSIVVDLGCDPDDLLVGLCRVIVCGRIFEYTIDCDEFHDIYHRACRFEAKGGVL